MDDPLISAIAIAFGVVIGLLIALVRMLRIPVIDRLLVVYISLARDAAVTLVLFCFFLCRPSGLTSTKRRSDSGADAQYFGL